uniref:Methyltransferase type 11 domain-containing protein n=1 Tax=Ditylenchus dipsaci TaxID=166011 RepID=A0A915EP80_9BILA
MTSQLLDNLKGIEIGGSAANPFGLNVLNVDLSDDNKVYKEYQILHAGKFTKVDTVASGDKLPFSDASQGFVISSHIIEHFYDPIKAIKNGLRVVQPGGYVYIIAPTRENI